MRPAPTFSARRRPTAGIGTAVLIGLAAAAQATAAQDPRATARPDVLLITLDTTRRDFMGFLGRKPSPTPHLDRLAAASIVFTDAITPAPLTLPAHASLLTGLHPRSHGVHDNSLYRLAPQARTLAEILAGQGYATRAAVAAFVLDPVFGLDQGFERYTAPPRGIATGPSVHFTERRAKEMVDLALADLAELARGRSQAPAGDDAAGATRAGDDGGVAGGAAEAAARPFLYWLHLFDPHLPYDPPNPPPLAPAHALDPVAMSRALYEAEIAAMDLELGRLFGELEARGLARDLVVVVAADHGEGLGEGRERTHGHFLFDPTVRVPLLLHDPRLAPARIDVPVSLADVAPTLLARLGVDARGERFDGLDLSPWIADPALAAPDRVLPLESWYVWLQYGWAPFEGCTHGALKYVRSQHEELFDRAADPGETTNRFAPDEPRARALARRLAELNQTAAALAATPPALSDADRRALQALGYATGGAQTEPPAGEWSELPDAYTKLAIIQGFDDAATAMERGEFARAIELLRGLAEREPRSALFHEQLGFMLVNVGAEDLGEAERELKRALELDPRRARVWFALARIELSRRDVARAKARALRESGDATRAREPAKLERERAAAAERALRECLRLEPTYPEALVELGRLLTDEAERAAARADRTRAAALYDEVSALAARLLAAVPPDSPEARDAATIQRLIATRRAALGD